MHFKSLWSKAYWVKAEINCQFSVPGIALTGRADLENPAICDGEVLTALKSLAQEPWAGRDAGASPAAGHLRGGGRGPREASDQQTRVHRRVRLRALEGQPAPSPPPPPAQPERSGAALNPFVALKTGWFTGFKPCPPCRPERGQAGSEISAPPHSLSTQTVSRVSLGTEI